MPYADYPIHFPDAILPAVVDGWFDAMTALYRMAPWREGSDSVFPLFVTIGSQDIHDAVLHPLAQNSEQPRGFALFTGPDDYEAWLALEATGDAPKESPTFPRLELTFGTLAEAHPAVQHELERHERGLGDAVPSVWSYNDAGKTHPGNVDDLIIFEAVAAAVAWTPDTTSEATESVVTDQTGQSVTRTVHAGAVDMAVELSASPSGAEAALPPDSLLDALRALDAAEDGWLAESQERYALQYRLGRRFLRSPEASDLVEGIHYWDTAARYAASHIGRTVASLEADGLDEVVFDIVPRKVSADVDFARPFIECLRAFYRWLEREYALPQAPACLARLNAPESVERLEALMGDSSNFDPAKAMVMQARAMGIDPSTPEGVMQMRALHDAQLSDSRPSLADFVPFYENQGTAPPLDPAVKRKRDAKRKSNRKAARKARKKNR